jgi:hypothetical protein
MAAGVKIKIFRNVTPCSVVHGSHIVKGKYFLHFQGGLNVYTLRLYVLKTVRIKKPPEMRYCLALQTATDVTNECVPSNFRLQKIYGILILHTFRAIDIHK